MKAFSKVVLAVAATVAVPSLAIAEDVGTKGSISSLQVNTDASLTYLQYHGRMTVVSGGKGSTSSVEYRWGGTSCGTKILTDSQLTMLQRALESGTPIVPRFELGQGGAKCVVGFSLEP